MVSIDLLPPNESNLVSVNVSVTVSVLETVAFTLSVKVKVAEATQASFVFSGAL